MVRNTPRVVCVQQCVAAERTSLVSYNMKDKHVQMSKAIIITYKTSTELTTASRLKGHACQ